MNFRQLCTAFLFVNAKVRETAQRFASPNKIPPPPCGVAVLQKAVAKPPQSRIIGIIATVVAYINAIQGKSMIGDGRAAVEIAAIRNTSVMIGKDRTFDDYFANSVTNVGLKGEQAEMNMLSQNAIMNDLRDLRDSISGVNIDEELAEIIKFQHGYNAAAKFVSVIDSLLDTVINRLGV